LEPTYWWIASVLGRGAETDLASTRRSA
jgi:hypothetical protein